jgi:hypothetical protein
MDTLPLECLQAIAGYLPQRDRAALRATAAWLAWSLPPAVCFDVEERMLQSSDPDMWRWGLQHVTSPRAPRSLFEMASRRGFVFALEALREHVGRDTAIYAMECTIYVAVLQYLREAFGLTAEDARTNNNAALQHSARSGNLAMVRYLREGFGLTAEDARANNNAALRHSAQRGDLAIVRYLREGFGLDAADARVENNAALLYCVCNGHVAMLRYLREGFGLDAADAAQR